MAELEAVNEDSASSTLKATMDELERERRCRAETDMRLQETEQMLEDQRMDSDNLHHNMSGKVCCHFMLFQTHCGAYSKISGHTEIHNSKCRSILIKHESCMFICLYVCLSVRVFRSQQKSRHHEILAQGVIWARLGHAKA